MKIEKVLNNNVVVSYNKKGHEIIVMGRGIAFKKSVGQLVETSKIEKIFTLSNSEMTNKLKEIVAEIPMEYIMISEQIIHHTIAKLGKQLSDSIYIALTDHIYNAVERYNKGIMLKNGLLWDIQRVYKEEFQIGKKAIQIINEAFETELLEDEAGFIALHIVNAQLGEEMPVVMNITKLVQEVLSIVKYYFKIEYQEESLSYYRFITHLKFFAQRLFSKTHYKGSNSDDLYNIFSTKLSEQYKCTQKIASFVKETYQYEIHREEMLYLMIHIAQVTNQALDCEN